MGEQPMIESARELGIREYLSVLRRRWRWVVLTTLSILLVIGGLTFSQQRVYEATAEVLILTDTNGALFPAAAATADRLERNAFAEQQYLSSETFREATGASPTGLPSVSYELAPSDPDQDLAETAILLFRARADTAVGAAAAANGHAETYIATRHQQDVSQTNDQIEVLEAGQRNSFGEIATLQQVLNELDNTGLVARVHNRAAAPTEPASPDVQRNMVFAAIAGLVLGVAAAIGRDLLDDTAFDPIELTEATGAPVLGAIGVMPKASYGLADLVHGNAYQTVLNSLSLSGRRPTLRTIAVTSATASVGKTETVINLARVEAAAGSAVLIIDGNPISPMVIPRLCPAARRGMDVDDAFAGQMAPTDEPIGSDIPKIDVFDLFASGAAPSDLVRTARLKRLLEKFEERYDLILIDTHAVLGSVDVRPLVTEADAVIVVYEPEKSRIDDLGRTIDLLRGARIHVTGMVANRAPMSAPGYQYTATFWSNSAPPKREARS
ncbi:MAG: AAA family ATPase [Acidimicrobiia bacterium]|nr:AAA family ATPase [Acidimicrobiia bacterium]